MVIEARTAFEAAGMAFILSAAAGLIMHPIMKHYYSKLAKKDLEDTHDLSVVIGIAERFVYCITIFANIPMVIVGWQAMKAFSNHKKIPSAETESTRRYYTYLVGNILSLALGVLGGLCLKVMFDGAL